MAAVTILNPVTSFYVSEEQLLNKPILYQQKWRSTCFHRSFLSVQEEAS